MNKANVIRIGNFLGEMWIDDSKMINLLAEMPPRGGKIPRIKLEFGDWSIFDYACRRGLIVDAIEEAGERVYWPDKKFDVCCLTKTGQAIVRALRAAGWIGNNPRQSLWKKVHLK